MGVLIYLVFVAALVGSVVLIGNVGFSMISQRRDITRRELLQGTKEKELPPPGTAKTEPKSNSPALLPPHIHLRLPDPTSTSDRSIIEVPSDALTTTDDAPFHISFSPLSDGTFRVINGHLIEERDRTMTLLDTDEEDTEYTARITALWKRLSHVLHRIEGVQRGRTDSNAVYAEGMIDLWEREKDSLAQEVRHAYESIREENSTQEEYRGRLKLDSFYDDFYGS